MIWEVVFILLLFTMSDQDIKFLKEIRDNYNFLISFLPNRPDQKMNKTKLEENLLLLNQFIFRKDKNKSEFYE